MTKKVYIRHPDREIEVEEGSTILGAALEQGVDYPHGCRSGRCGSCKSRLLGGSVDLLDHTRFALTDLEKRAGLILACRALPTSNVRVAWLGGGEEVVDHPRRILQGTVVGIEDATHDIKLVKLAIDGGKPLAFSAGQYVRLTFPGCPTRDYSMANRPGEPELVFHIRRVPGGAVTERIHGRVRLGNRVEVDGPSGSSFLREKHAGPLLCIAGGSGLAPIKSIVETALAQAMKQPIHVYSGARTERDLYLVDHFYGLEASHPNVTFTPVLSEAGSGGRWRTGLVTEAIAEDLKDLDGWKAYIAGPPAMVDAAQAVATDRGLRRDDVHADAFFTPEPLSAQETRESVSSLEGEQP